MSHLRTKECTPEGDTCASNMIAAKAKCPSAGKDVPRLGRLSRLPVSPPSISRVAPAKLGRFRIRCAVAQCGGHTVPSVFSPASLATSAAWLPPRYLDTPYGRMCELHRSRLSRGRNQFVHEEQLRLLKTKAANVGLTGAISSVVSDSSASISLSSQHGCPSVVEEFRE